MPRRLIPAAALLGALTAALLAAPAVAPAQDVAVPALRVVDSSQVQILTLHGGSTLIGRVTSIDADSIRFATAVGELRLARTDVALARVVPASAMHRGAYWFPDPNVSRLLFAPTGRMLPRGGGYVSNHYVILPGVNVGVTDRLTLGGGMSLIPGIGLGNQLWYLTPKVGLVASPRLNVAAGALLVAVPDDEDGNDLERRMVGILYSVASYGNPNAEVTAGLGYGLNGSELADSPALMLGGRVRLARRLSFVTENYLLPGFGRTALVSYALRFMGEQNSLDLGFLNSTDTGIFPGVPFVGYVFNFGRR